MLLMLGFVGFYVWLNHLDFMGREGESPPYIMISLYDLWCVVAFLWGLLCAWAVIQGFRG